LTFRYMQKDNNTRNGTVALIVSIIVLVSTIPVLAFAQQQTSFVANLSGKNVTPPVNTPATGTAKFQVNPNGTLSYELDVMNLNKVIGSILVLKMELNWHNCLTPMRLPVLDLIRLNQFILPV
jgi:CHRD domain